MKISPCVSCHELKKIKIEIDIPNPCFIIFHNIKPTYFLIILHHFISKQGHRQHHPDSKISLSIMKQELIDIYDSSPHRCTHPEDKEEELCRLTLVGEIESPIIHQSKHSPKKPFHLRQRCISDDSKCSNTSLGYHDLSDEQTSYPSHSNLHSQSVDSFCFGTTELFENNELSSSPKKFRQKRRRDECEEEEEVVVGLDLSYHSEDSRSLYSQDSSYKLHKRRRVTAGRNKALCASDFNDIFSQIGC